MKTCGVLLVLLCCCLAEKQLRGETISENDITHQGHYGEAESRENEVTGTAERAEDTDTASTQQTGQRDILAALTDMSALIAEQKVELGYTKRQVEALETRLRDSERTVEEQRVELRYTKTQVEAVEARLRASENKAEAMETRLRDSEMTVEEQRVELGVAKAQLEELKKENGESKVAFSASFAVSSDKHIGPFNTAITLVFDHVFTNMGSAYDPNSGIFTAPVRGVYQFRYHIFAGGSHGAGANIVKNGQHVVAAYNHIAPHDINTSQGVSLPLEKGDTVSLRMGAGAWVSAYTGHYTTFSGQLLFLI